MNRTNIKMVSLAVFGAFLSASLNPVVAQAAEPLSLNEQSAEASALLNQVLDKLQTITDQVREGAKNAKCPEARAFWQQMATRVREIQQQVIQAVKQLNACQWGAAAASLQAIMAKLHALVGFIKGAPANALSLLQKLALLAPVLTIIAWVTAIIATVALLGGTVYYNVKVREICDPTKNPNPMNQHELDGIGGNGLGGYWRNVCEYWRSDWSWF